MLLPGSDGVSLAGDDVYVGRFRKIYNVVVARRAPERTAGNKSSRLEMERDRNAISLSNRKASTESTLIKSPNGTHDLNVKLLAHNNGKSRTLRLDRKDICGEHERESNNVKYRPSHASILFGNAPPILSPSARKPAGCTTKYVFTQG